MLLIIAASFEMQGQTFTFTGNMTSPRSFHTTTVLPSGLVLVTGGRLRGNFNENTAELYNPASRTFSATGNLNMGRNSQAAALLSNGEVLIVGGQDDVNNQIHA